MRLQITLTVNEAKRIIAKGIARLPEVREASRRGRIFMKGGQHGLLRCRRVDRKHEPGYRAGSLPMAPKPPRITAAASTGVIVEKGKLICVDDSVAEGAARLRDGDVFIVGANAIDVYGNAALMYGAPLGAVPATVLAGLMGEVSNVFIAAGLEKLVPGSLTEIMARVGRRGVDLSMGMAVGLTPVSGRIISENVAVPLLADVSCTVVGRGGVFGAEGGHHLAG